MAQVIKIRKDTDPDDIYIVLTCSVTNKRFRHSLDGGFTRILCRCARESFEVDAAPAPGFLRLEVTHIDRWGKREEVEQFDVTIDES